jgi:hypothetical protein
MKSNTHPIDPLEETMENPDLPPLAPVRIPHSRGVASSSRRHLRVTLTLSVVVLLLAIIGARLAA